MQEEEIRALEKPGFSPLKK